MNTTSVGLAVTPAVVATLLSHYTNRKSLKQKPTAHLPYHEGLHLIRSFLQHASHHTVEEIQAFTGQWVPHPQWVKVEDVQIADDAVARAAALLQKQLGPDGVRKIGGGNWWQWRKKKTPLKAEWIQMRSHYNQRKKTGALENRVMFYVHGGAYYFGGVDEHRYQIQRHARKLGGRAFAPRYRLAPQFPFPCGLLDCLAAYIHLLTVQEPNTIVFAGDSAGGGMVMSLLVLLRDQGIPLPAGAVLISPWVDLTHSFPSVAGDCPLDYIPQSGFHHKPSMAWPPPNEDEVRMLKKAVVEQKANNSPPSGSGANEVPTIHETAQVKSTLFVKMDGKDVVITEQIQMYTTNDLLAHPLVSPIMQPSLGGLPPLLVMVGGGEILRDEQIYLAHKCADPKSYLPPEHLLNERDWAQIERYKPTDVQLQVWDDLCHVAPTLSFTRPAKYMYRSVAQFSAWALARAQKTEIEILDDDEISDISQSESETEGQAHGSQVRIGKAGDPLPRFRNHMVRQRVSRHGEIYVLAPASELAGCSMSRGDVGVVKALTVSKWLGQNREWDRRFRQAKSRIHKRRLKEVSAGYEIFEQGDVPPPSALAGRRKIGAVSEKEKKRARSMGLALWSVWGSKHDEVAVQREEKADKEEPEVISATGIEGQGARSIQGIEKQTNHPIRPPLGASTSRSRYRRRLVRDESQAEEFPDENTAVEGLLALRREQSSPTGHPISGESSRSGASLLTPTYRPNTGVSGKRPRIDGIAVPFSLGKEADTASMLTLTSAMDQNTYPPTPHPMSPTEPLTSAKTDKQVGTSQPNPRPACSATPATSITDDRQVAPSRPVSAANGTAAPTGSSIKVDHGDEHDSAEEHQKHEDPDALGEGTASPLFM